MAKVQIVMRGGVVGEDQKDWLADEAHEATPAFARDLVKRSLAFYATEEDAEAAEGVGRNPGGVLIVNADPAVKSRDPKVEKK